MMMVDLGSRWKTLKVTGWYWKILNVADSSRKKLLDPGSEWNVLKVTERFLKVGCLRWNPEG